MDLLPQAPGRRLNMASARRLRRPQPPEEAANAATATGGSRLRCRSRRAWAAVVLAGSFQKVLEATAAGETAQMLRLASLASRVPTSAEEFRKPRAWERWRPTVQVYRCSGGNRMGSSKPALKNSLLLPPGGVSGGIRNSDALALRSPSPLKPARGSSGSAGIAAAAVYRPGTVTPCDPWSMSWRWRGGMPVPADAAARLCAACNAWLAVGT
mmetsp:Transcript_8195/g.24418  ORF Transcript_8195/g.24418 Transcript_8195/m.24418 type:complete len:212 (-) Transcript_8195:940-1575(-)